MINKLHSLFPGSLLLKAQPLNSMDTYHVLFDRSTMEWLAIPRTEVDERELFILQAIYELIEPQAPILSPLIKGWQQFLFQNGQPPVYEEEKVRIIQFRLQGDMVEQSELESALKGFFSDDILVIWENRKSGVIILKQSLPLIAENDIISMSRTLESDFYVKIFFFLGKQYVFSPLLPKRLFEEHEYFTFGQNHLAHMKVFTLERIFPAYLAFHLSDSLKEKMNPDLIHIFKEDPEMFTTLKIFLESNLNASLTAKKLYIHRNTLQYRIEKFTEKTGIQLKDFHSAFTVFLTCLVYEQNYSK